MKTYKKEKLFYKDGYITTKKGKIVNIDNEIVDLFNKLEEDVQLAAFSKDQQACLECAQDTISQEFERKSERVVAEFEVVTDKLDEAIEYAKGIMDDIDRVCASDKANDYLKGIDPVVQFVHDDFVISCEQSTQHRFDLPTLGNPLEFNMDKLFKAVYAIFA